MSISLAGQVTNSQNGLGQNGMLVQAILNGQAVPTATTTTTNDANGKPGYWSFSGLADGLYNIVVLCPYGIETLYAPSQVQFNQIVVGADKALLDQNGNLTLQGALAVTGASTLTGGWQAGAWCRVTGTSGVSASGQGLELAYNSSIGWGTLIAYNRGTSSNLNLGLGVNPSNGQSLLSLYSDGGVFLGTAGSADPGGNNLQILGNFLVGTGTGAGGGNNVVVLHNSTPPTSNPASGGILYVDSGALKYRGSSGTVTTLAGA